MSRPIRGKVQPFLIGCLELCRLSSGGILLVGEARGLHLLDRSSNRLASWETLTPGEEKGEHLIQEPCNVLFLRQRYKW